MAEAYPLDVEQAQALVEQKRRSGAAGGRLGLAQALAELSQALEKVDREQEAEGAARDSVNTLAPDFLANPRQFAAPMRALVGQYVTLAQHRGGHPDETMLGPIAQALGELTRAEDAEED